MSFAGWRALRVAVGLLLFAALGLAFEVPALEGHVNDRAGLLSVEQRQRLEARLAAYESQTGQQFALLTVPDLAGLSIEDYSIRVAESWKLGQKGKDDGLLLLIAPKERRMRIEVGYGLEGNVPDALAGRIVRGVLTPEFRAGRYAQGIDAAFDALMQAASGQEVKLPESAPHRSRDTGDFPMLVISGVFWLLVILFMGGRGGGMGMLLLGGAMMGGRRGGGGFGGGGGGGFGGGGGGFGGGGASGSW